MKLPIIASSLLALFLSNAAFSNDMPSSSESIIVKQQFEVLSINHDEKWVQLKDRSGFTKKVNVGSNTTNFDQVKVGDIVNVNYAETIVIKAFGADAINAGVESESIFANAAKGQKPAKAMATAKTIVVTIAAIDLKNSLVTLKDKSGNTKTFRPRTVSNLQKVKVGDKVAVSFAKAIAITVKEGDK